MVAGSGMKERLEGSPSAYPKVFGSGETHYPRPLAKLPQESALAKYVASHRIAYHEDRLRILMCHDRRPAAPEKQCVNARLG